MSGDSFPGQEAVSRLSRQYIIIISLITTENDQPMIKTLGSRAQNRDGNFVVNPIGNACLFCDIYALAKPWPVMGDGGGGAGLGG